MKTTAISVLLGLAFCFALAGWRMGSDTTRYHPVSGQWERLKPKGLSSNQYWQTLLFPGEPSEITFTTRLPIVGSYCFYYEAEKGPGSFEISAQLVPTVSQGIHTGMKPGSNWFNVYPETVCARDHGVRFLVTSPTLQTFRVSRYVHQGRETPQTGHWDGLCPPLSRNGRCPDAMPLAATYPTQADIVARSRRHYTIAFFLTLLSATIWVGPLFLLGVVFPSKHAAAVRDEIRSATSSNQPYKSFLNKSYRERSKNMFRCKQDIEDLKKLIDEATRNAARVKRELDGELDSERAYQSKIKELDLAIARVKELKAQLDNAD